MRQGAKNGERVASMLKGVAEEGFEGKEDERIFWGKIVNMVQRMGREARNGRGKEGGRTRWRMWWWRRGSRRRW